MAFLRDKALETMESYIPNIAQVLHNVPLIPSLWRLQIHYLFRWLELTHMNIMLRSTNCSEEHTKATMMFSKIFIVILGK